MILYYLKYCSKANKLLGETESLGLMLIGTIIVGAVCVILISLLNRKKPSYVTGGFFVVLFACVLGLLVYFYFFSTEDILRVVLTIGIAIAALVVCYLVMAIIVNVMNRSEGMKAGRQETEMAILEGAAVQENEAGPLREFSETEVHDELLSPVIPAEVGGHVELASDEPLEISRNFVEDSGADSENIGGQADSGELPKIVQTEDPVSEENLLKSPVETESTVVETTTMIGLEESPMETAEVIVPDERPLETATMIMTDKMQNELAETAETVEVVADAEGLPPSMIKISLGVDEELYQLLYKEDNVDEKAEEPTAIAAGVDTVREESLAERTVELAGSLETEKVAADERTIDSSTCRDEAEIVKESTVDEPLAPKAQEIAVVSENIDIKKPMWMELEPEEYLLDENIDEYISEITNELEQNAQKHVHDVDGDAGVAETVVERADAVRIDESGGHDAECAAYDEGHSEEETYTDIPVEDIEYHTERTVDLDVDKEMDLPDPDVSFEEKMLDVQQGNTESGYQKYGVMAELRVLIAQKQYVDAIEKVFMILKSGYELDNSEKQQMKLIVIGLLDKYM